MVSSYSKEITSIVAGDPEYETELINTHVNIVRVFFLTFYFFFLLHFPFFIIIWNLFLSFNPQNENVMLCAMSVVFASIYTIV